MNRIEIKIRKLIGLENRYKDDSEKILVVSDYLFYQTNDFRGVSGLGYEIVTDDDADNMWYNLENEDDSFLKSQWKESVQMDQTEDSFNDWKEIVIEEMKDEQDYPYQDKPSYWLTDEEEIKIRESLGFDKDQVLYYGVVQCGRMIDKDDEFEEIYCPDIIEAIKEFEDNSIEMTRERALEIGELLKKNYPEEVSINIIDD